MKTLKTYSVAVSLVVLGLACRDRLGPVMPPPTGEEREPNNSLLAADTVVLGDSVVGQVRLPGDIDYFTVELQAGTNVAVELSGLRSVKDWTWILSLLDSAGGTLSRNDEYVEWLPGTRIWYTVNETGRYYVRLNNEPVWSGADPNATTGDYPYSLRVAAFGATSEREPNNVAEAANTVAFGDTISGILESGDTDYFALDLNAGTNLNLDVASLEVSCNVATEVRLLTADGTMLARETGSPYNGSHNPRLEYIITATGRYFVRLGVHYLAQTVGTPCYFLKIGTFTLPPPAPGEPVRVVASNLGDFSAIATNNVGDVFLSTGICEAPERSATDQVARLEEDGRIIVIADHLMLTGELVVDAVGNILAPGLERAESGDRGVVWRITPGGERSIFAQPPGLPCAIAVGPDGDVWVSDVRTAHTLRLDSLGNVKSSIALGFHVERMRFSPTGVLYYHKLNALFKLANSDTVQVADPGPLVWTFDRDGYQYAWQDGYNGYNLRGKIVLRDPNGQLVVDPVARLNIPLDITFVRDRSGAPTKRLWVLRYGDGGFNDLVELNPAGIRAPGP